MLRWRVLRGRLASWSTWLVTIEHPDARVRRRGRVVVIVAAALIATFVVMMFALMAVLPQWPLAAAIIIGMSLPIVGIIVMARRGRVTAAGLIFLLITYLGPLSGALANGFVSELPLHLVCLVLVAGMALPPRILPYAVVVSFLLTLMAPLVVGGRVQGVPYAQVLTISTVIACIAALIAGVNNWVMDRSFTEAAKLTDALRQANDELELRVLERTSELTTSLRQTQLLADQLAELSARDPLTGLFNRRRLEAEFDRVGSGARLGDSVSVALVDLDDFKRVNDTLGHHVGDVVLQRVAAALLTGCRDSDVVARTGGEEFILLLPGTRSEDAIRTCERLRATVEALTFGEVAPNLRMTVSIGIASSASASASGGMRQTLLQQADEMLYAAKRSGKNKVLSCLWQAVETPTVDTQSVEVQTVET